MIKVIQICHLNPLDPLEAVDGLENEKGYISVIVITLPVMY